MTKYLNPHLEQARIRELLSYKILDTDEEAEYNNLTELASSICNVPICLISLVDANRQWFKSCFGLTGAKETSRDISFCGHAINQDKIFIVDDPLNDERFKNNPLVVNAPGIRFYAGVPLINEKGFALGTLCLIDSKKNSLTEKQISQLEKIAQQVLKLMELHRSKLEITQNYEEISVLTQKNIEQNQLLEQALIEAEKAVKVKSSFIANLSHEIRTPLNGISGILSLLEDSDLTAEQEDYIQTIKNSSASLLHVINDILDFSKIESGKLDIESININLDNEIQHIAKTISHGAKKKGVEFSVNSSLCLTNYIKGDPYRLKQILLNLGTNAVKFTEKGSIELTVNSHVEGDLVFVEFAIKDSGIGMTLEQQEKLFQPFTQADSSTTRKFGGTGLGLSIVKQLVFLMGGELKLRSQINIGSEFIVKIPFEQTSIPINKQVKSLKISNINSQGNNVCVLMAEDNEVNQTVQKSILEKMGYLVDIANNGHEVLSKVGTQEYDIILMDMQMPEMDGIECTKKLRHNEKTRHIPIIALTANTIKGDKDRCLEAGMNDFISKPFDARTLNDIIFKLIPHLKVVDLPSLDSFTSRFDGLGKEEMNEEEIKLLLETFYSSSVVRLNRINEAYRSGELKVIQTEVHSLKSASLYMGEQKLSELCAVLENTLKRGASREEINIFNSLTREFKKVISKYDLIINEPAS